MDGLHVLLYLLPGADFPELFIPPETAQHEDTPLQLGPAPHPIPWGGFPTPRHMLAALPMGGGPPMGV